MNALVLLSTFLPALLQVGQIIPQVWPAASGILNALEHGVTTPAQQINVVSMLQEALNALQQAGEIQFGAPLVVDGQFGGRTFGAIKALQTKLGLTVQEPLASMEYRMLQALLAKLG